MPIHESESHLLPIPPLLISGINTIAWKTFPSGGLMGKISFLNVPMVLLKSIEEIRHASDYEPLKNELLLGIRCQDVTGAPVELPHLDADLFLFLAINVLPGDDSAVALDYRTGLNAPRVVASDWTGPGDTCQWRVVAPNFESFAQRFLEWN